MLTESSFSTEMQKEGWFRGESKATAKQHHSPNLKHHVVQMKDCLTILANPVPVGNSEVSLWTEFFLNVVSKKLPPLCVK